MTADPNARSPLVAQIADIIDKRVAPRMAPSGPYAGAPLMHGLGKVGLTEAAEEIIDHLSAALQDGEPVAYRYRYYDPASGDPVWSFKPPPWNGQQPIETQPLYAHPATLKADVLGLAVAEVRERCAQIVLAHKPDASFDDSAEGHIERQALLANIAAEIRADLRLAERPEGDRP